MISKETNAGSPGDVAAPSPTGATQCFCVLVFDSSHLVALRRAGAGGAFEPAVRGRVVSGESSADAVNAAASMFAARQVRPTAITRVVSPEAAGDACEVYFVLLETEGAAVAGVEWLSLEEAQRIAREQPAGVSPLLRAVLGAIEPHIIRIPYLNRAETDYIYRFRTEEQRNRSVYAGDIDARDLYQSALCEAIKAARRQRERTASAPARLDFGAVRYVLPSHFGFCLGVQNAIERAYETIAANPGRRVFMISELIHNPFVNDDLRARGLIYLQSDRGAHFSNPATGRAWWDELQRGDIVLTPAFGATNEDKARLVAKGIAINRYDATCMLVEKVWKAARRFAEAGFTVVIHGKSEHEETKATFSNCAEYGPALIIRDRREAEQLGAVILAATRAEKERLFAAFAGRHTAGFEVERDLERIAVVNQTTLLRNETVGIIDYLEQVMTRKYGPLAAAERLHMKSRGDTLCYATQVNQDALERAIAAGADVAIVVGGRNSSNTFQLFRLCEARFGERAFYIQSEGDVLSRERILHYIFPYRPDAPGAGAKVERAFLPAGGGPFTVLITGGASCPDGVIQQVIARINALFAPREIRSVAEVLGEFAAAAETE